MYNLIVAYILCSYTSGEVIFTNVLLTANHMGWFEYRLCVPDTVDGVETEECFNTHLLKVQDGSSTRYEITSSHTGDFPVTVHLPEGVKCERCVLQWHYNTGQYNAQDLNYISYVLLCCYFPLSLNGYFYHKTTDCDYGHNISEMFSTKLNMLRKCELRCHFDPVYK